MSTTSCWLTFAILLTSTGQVPEQKRPKSLTLDELVRLHTETVQGIASLKAKVTETRTLPATFGGRQPGNEYTVILNGEEVRIEALIRSISSEPTGSEGAKQKKEYHYTVYNGSKGSRSIEGLDPNSPPPFQESNDHNVFGYIGPHLDHKGRLRLNPYSPLLLQIPDFGGDSRSLQQFIKTAKVATIEQTPDANPEQCYVVKADHGNVTYRIWINPARGYVVNQCRLEESAPAVPSGRMRQASFKVTEYQAVKGFSLPKSTTAELIEGATITVDYAIRVESLNESIPPSEMNVQFPDWMRVSDQMSGKFHIWGPDDTPRKTFRNVEEYREWYAPLEAARSQPPAPSRFRRFAVIGGWAVVAVVAGFIVWRRWYAGHHRSKIPPPESTA